MTDVLQDNIAQWQKSEDPKQAQRILAALEPVINNALRAYGADRDPIAKAQARLLVLGGLKRYDPDRAGVSTFVNSELRRMGRLTQQAKSPIPVPERQWRDYQELLSAQTEFEAEEGRAPTIDELSERTRLSPKRIVAIRSRSRPVVYESRVYTPGDEAGTALGNERPDYSDLQLGAFYDSLTDPIDKNVFEWTTGVNGAEIIPKTEIAGRLRLTPAAISQRTAKLSDRLGQFQADFDKVYL